MNSTIQNVSKGTFDFSDNNSPFVSLHVWKKLRLAFREVMASFHSAYFRGLTMKNHWTDITPYGATDGLNLLLNPKGITDLANSDRPIQRIAFLLAHEYLHALLNHGVRLKAFEDRKMANIAADLIINGMLVEQNQKILFEKDYEPFIMPKGGCYDPKLDHNEITVPELYRKLMSGEKEAPQQPDAPTGEVGTGAESDVLSPEESGLNNSPEGELSDRIEQQNQAIRTHEDIAKQLGGAGSDGMGRVIAKQANADPTGLDWADVLKDYLMVKSEQGWDSPVNVPIMMNAGLYTAGRGGKKAEKLVFVIDTSGSASDSTLKKIIDGLGEVFRTLNPEVMNIVHADWRVHRDSEVWGVEDLPDTLEGGGGTLLRPALQYCRDNHEDAYAIVYLTDGFAGDLWDLDPSDTGNLDVIWLTYDMPTNQFQIGEAIEVNAFA